jgi:hypothetical protein
LNCGWAISYGSDLRVNTDTPLFEMMLPFKPQQLQTPLSAKTALEVTRALGPLAGYWLNQPAWAAGSSSSASLQRPKLSPNMGNCWALIGVRNPAWRQYLMPAVVIPLNWSDNFSGDDKRLPPAVLNLAERVRKFLAPEIKSLLDELEMPVEPDRQWTIGFIDRQQSWPDLSFFDLTQLTAESCFVSLGAGLQSAMTRFASNPHVAASASWNNKLNDVDLLSEKRETAKLFGIKKLFVTATQTIEQTETTKLPELERLTWQSDSRLLPALAPFWAESVLAPPTEDAAVSIKFYINLREFNENLARKYYLDVLLPHIVDHCRQNIHLSEKSKGLQAADVMISIVSGAIEPIPVIANSLSVKHLLILYSETEQERKARPLTGEMANKADQIKRLFAEKYPECFVNCQPFLYDPRQEQFPTNFVRELKANVNSTLKQYSAGTVIFDIDRGTTLQKISLLQSIVRPTDYLVTMVHQHNRRNKVMPGRERLLVWQQGEDLARDCFGLMTD